MSPATVPSRGPSTGPGAPVPGVAICPVTFEPLWTSVSVSRRSAMPPRSVPSHTPVTSTVTRARSIQSCFAQPEPSTNAVATKAHRALIGGDSIPVRDRPPEGCAPNGEDRLVGLEQPPPGGYRGTRRAPSTQPPPARAKSARPSLGTFPPPYRGAPAPPCAYRRGHKAYRDQGD